MKTRVWLVEEEQGPGNWVPAPSYATSYRTNAVAHAKRLSGWAGGNRFRVTEYVPKGRKKGRKRNGKA